MTYLVNIPRDDTIIVKVTPETITSSAAFQDDDEFFFSAAANTNYEIQMILKLQCASATPDFKWQFTTLTSARWMGGGHYRDLDNGGLNNFVTPQSSANSTVTPIPIASTVEQMYVYLDASYVTAGTSGTVYFRWAQNTSNATGVSLTTGSHMWVKNVGTNA